MVKYCLRKLLQAITLNNHLRNVFLNKKYPRIHEKFTSTKLIFIFKKLGFLKFKEISFTSKAPNNINSLDLDLDLANN
jgi:hypothetical protein